MKLESQVTSLELSKRLKELGVRQGSYFYWYCPHEHSQRIVTKVNSLEENYSAFTVAELGEMLPDEFPGNSESVLGSFVVRIKDFQRWHVRYTDDENKDVLHSVESDTEADARAKMLIYLLENKLITV